MTTTKLITHWMNGYDDPSLGVLAAVVGNFAGDYDLIGAAQDYLSAVQGLLPAGLTLHANGDVYGPADFDGDVDVRELAEEVNLVPILKMHELNPHGWVHISVDISLEVDGHTPSELAALGWDEIRQLENPVVKLRYDDGAVLHIDLDEQV